MQNSASLTDFDPAKFSILCVDDEPNILSALRRMFMLAGFVVEEAQSGAQALQKLEQKEFHLVLSDMQMPEMNGTDFLIQVRKRWPKVMRLLLTGAADLKAAISAINEGEIYRYLTKPWNDEEVVSIVKAALENFALVRERDQLLALTEQQNLALIEKSIAEQNKAKELERRKLYESFITMLVHEIKTPLSVIQLAASSLSRHLSDNTSETNRINNIKRSVAEINQIFNKCIQVVDLENGSISIDPSEFDLDTLVEEITRNVDDPRLQCNYPANSKINTDFMLLKTILLNLLSNALKYGKLDELVKLDIRESSSTPSQKISFGVTNVVGEVGLPDMNQVFKPYYRSESAKKYAGSGLGLWLSQELASILGSRIVLHHQNNVLQFELTLEVKK